MFEETFVDPIISQIASVAPKAPTALVAFVAAYVVMRMLQMALGIVLETAHVNKAMRGIVQSSVGFILWLGVLALVFHSLGLNQIAIALSGSVAVIGVGVATGANKLFSDLLAGLFLAKNRDFKIGQRIKIADVEGQIHSLDSRKVRILGKDDAIYVIPNTKFDEQTWQIQSNKKN